MSRKLLLSMMVLGMVGCAGETAIVVGNWLYVWVSVGSFALGYIVGTQSNKASR